jgi:hypothetical protein
MSLNRAWMLVLAVSVCSATAEGSSSADPNDFFSSPQWLAQKYLSSSDWPSLDKLIERLAKDRERSEDGRFKLYLTTSAVADRFKTTSLDMDDELRRQFEEYRTTIPESAFAPIIAAMHMHARAWRARGTGFASTVTPEGQALFKERSSSAWKSLQAAKHISSRLPTWYEQAITVGIDADVSRAEVLKLFNEGITRFPGYHPLYFSYARQLAPRWGGSYASADAFVQAQVAAKTNLEGEALYARLYWLFDQYGGRDPDFFAESMVSWPRMRKGFELLMKQFPDSAWNKANFVSFACRAGDAPTYAKWRDTVDAGVFSGAAPDGLSLEVCDLRFANGRRS